jgi:uncharacterized protein YabE (DUF348 family)
MSWGENLITAVNDKEVSEELINDKVKENSKCRKFLQKI